MDNRYIQDVYNNLLIKYSNDKDVLFLMAKVSEQLVDIQNKTKKLNSYKQQLKGLHKYINAKKLTDTLEGGE